MQNCFSVTKQIFLTITKALLAIHANSVSNRTPFHMVMLQLFSLQVNKLLSHEGVVAFMLPPGIKVSLI